MTEIRGADGVRLVVRHSGEGRPVVFVHGSSGGLDAWSGVTDHLPDVQAWVYARRGYSPSDDTVGGGSVNDESADGGGHRTFDDDAADAVAVLRHVREVTGELPALLGGSYGARVALQVALDHPTDLRTLVVFEPPLYSAGDELRPVLDRHRELLAAGRFAAAERLFAERVARVPAELLDQLGLDGAEPAHTDDAAIADGWSCHGDLRAMAADRSSVTDWAGIAVPRLVVRGERTWDPMPAVCDELARAMDCECTVLAGQNHFVTATAPDVFAAAVHGPLTTG